MTYELSNETKEQFDAVHKQGKELGRDGKAFDLEDDRDGRHSITYWDEETEQWLHGNDTTEMDWVMFPRDEFPHGLELIISWGDYEVVPVEETRLWHGTYGLDQARDGYGPQNLTE